MSTRLAAGPIGTLHVVSPVVGTNPSIVTSSPSKEDGPLDSLVVMPRCLQRTGYSLLPRLHWKLLPRSRQSTSPFSSEMPAVAALRSRLLTYLEPLASHAPYKEPTMTCW